MGSRITKHNTNTHSTFSIELTDQPVIMSDLHVAVGASLVTCGTVTGGYLAYKLHNARTTRQRTAKPNVVLLSETLAAVAIGILNIYSYACCANCSTDTATDAEGFNQTRNTGENKTLADCATKFACTNREIVMDQIVLTATAVHCLLSLITTSFLCKNCVISEKKCDSAEPSTSTEKTRLQPRNLTANQSTIGLVVAHWILPVLTVFCLYYSMQMADAKQMCQHLPVPPNVVDNFHDLVSELLENPMNVTEKSVYETEIDSIVGKVYSIVESATTNDEEHSTPQMTDLDEGFSVSDIMNKLNSINKRAPKQLKFEQNINTTGFKVYTVFFILLAFLVPIVYTNIERMKLKMHLDMATYAMVENRVKELMKYLNMSIVSVLMLWTPSFVETFSRTYITESQPNLAMQILMAIGSIHMIFRNGLNVKLLKILSGQSNSVQPKV